MKTYHSQMVMSDHHPIFRRESPLSPLCLLSLPTRNLTSDQHRFRPVEITLGFPQLVSDVCRYLTKFQLHPLCRIEGTVFIGESVSQNVLLSEPPLKVQRRAEDASTSESCMLMIIKGNFVLEHVTVKEKRITLRARV